MIRPEITAALLRWREALIGLAVFLLSAYGAATAFGVVKWLSWLGVAIGAALMWEGARRARFPAGAGGPGVVELDERQITYFGPTGGAAVSVDDLSRVEIRTTDAGPMNSDLFWVFTQTDGLILRIPGDAQGVEVLFDALAMLPGVDYHAATQAAGTTRPQHFVIWQKHRLPSH